MYYEQRSKVRPVSHEPQPSHYRPQKHTTSAPHMPWIADFPSYCTSLIQPYLAFIGDSNTTSLPEKRLVCTWVAYWVQCSNEWQIVCIFFLSCCRTLKKSLGTIFGVSYFKLDFYRVSFMYCVGSFLRIQKSSSPTTECLKDILNNSYTKLGITSLDK